MDVAYLWHRAGSHADCGVGRCHLFNDRWNQIKILRDNNPLFGTREAMGRNFVIPSLTSQHLRQTSTKISLLNNVMKVVPVALHRTALDAAPDWVDLKPKNGTVRWH